jgi:hypothetical protein
LSGYKYYSWNYILLPVGNGGHEQPFNFYGSSNIYICGRDAYTDSYEYNDNYLNLRYPHPHINPHPYRNTYRHDHPDEDPPSFSHYHAHTFPVSCRYLYLTPAANFYPYGYTNLHPYTDDQPHGYYNPGSAAFPDLVVSVSLTNPHFHANVYGYCFPDPSIAYDYT